MTENETENQTKKETEVEKETEEETKSESKSESKAKNVKFDRKDINAVPPEAPEGKEWKLLKTGW